MSSAELFAQAHQLRHAAADLRTRARDLARALDEVQQAPGDATNSLGHETWAGAKATTNERLMHDAYDLLSYVAAQTATDVEDLEYQARQLDSQAEQTESQARQAAFAEAEAEAEAEAVRQRALKAAAVASSAASATATPTPTPVAQPVAPPPALVFAPIETVPAASTPTPATAEADPAAEAADFLY
jgi:hypothetical protein